MHIDTNEIHVKYKKMYSMKRFRMVYRYTNRMIECIIQMNFWFIDRRTNFLSYLKCNIFFLRKENIEDQHLHQVTFITKLFITWKKCVNWSTFFGEIWILIYVIIGNQENTRVKNKKNNNLVRIICFLFYGKDVYFE